MNSSVKEIARTKRLILREASLDDAEFVLELINDPGWLKYIYQHSINSLEKAKDYINERLLSAYKQHDYGLWLMQRASDSAMIGMCGLVRRETLPGPDLGFAQLEKYTGQGYAQEASEAAIQYAIHNSLATELLAITLPENQPSIRLLERLGFSYDKDFIPEDTDERLLMYALNISNDRK
ncbi:MAG: GNAT family N-acetyltransferase [Pseudomonadota bacterium]